MYGNHQVYSNANQAQNWCMDYTVDGPAWMAFKQANMIELERDYPGMSSQPQSCAQLGFTAEHISPLYHSQVHNYVDKDTGVTVANKYWMRPSLMELTTNIPDLRTSGLLNSHANRWTTTNVGHLYGDRHSTMTLSELNWFTDKLAAAKEAAAKAAAATKAKAAAVAAATKEEAAHVKQAVVDKTHAVVDKTKEIAQTVVQVTKEEASEIISSASDAIKAEAAKLANILIDDAEKEGRVITKEMRHKIFALSIQLKRGARHGLHHTRHEVDAALDPLKTGPVSTAVINYFENMEVEIDQDAMHEIKEILRLLRHEANHEIRKTDHKINHALNEIRPVAAYLLI